MLGAFLFVREQAVAVRGVLGVRLSRGRVPGDGADRHFPIARADEDFGRRADQREARQVEIIEERRRIDPPQRPVKIEWRKARTALKNAAPARPGRYPPRRYSPSREAPSRDTGLRRLRVRERHWCPPTTGERAPATAPQAVPQRFQSVRQRWIRRHPRPAHPARLARPETACPPDDRTQGSALAARTACPAMPMDSERVVAVSRPARRFHRRNSRPGRRALRASLPEYPCGIARPAYAALSADRRRTAKTHHCRPAIVVDFGHGSVGAKYQIGCEPKQRVAPPGCPAFD